VKVALEAVHVECDDNGFWYHPDAPWDEIGEQPIVAFLQPHGYEGRVTLMQNVMDEEEEPLRSYLDGAVDIRTWMPSPPDGEGWFLLCISDSEDGPFAIHLRRVAPKVEP
jgi:integrase/recombinase XerC